MGLIRLTGTALGALGAGINAVDGALSSSMYKEYFVSGDMSGGILMKRGERVTGNGTKNKNADENLISSGSAIDVQEGQCMIIVDNGQVVDFSAEPGRFVFDKSTQPSLFGGGNNGLKAFGREIMTQWAAGGQRFTTQKVYFINMGEQIFSPIKWGCGDIAFHHTAFLKNGAPPIELPMSLKGNGELTVRIIDPMLFFKQIGAQKVGGNNDGMIKLSDQGIANNLRSNIVDKIAQAISILGEEQSIPYTALRSKSDDISRHINELLSNEWAGKRGFEVCTFSVNGSFIPSEEDKATLKEIQQSYIMGANTNAAIYDIQKGYSDGAREAGKNPNGATNGFMGMGMAGMMGGFGQGMGQMQPTPNAYQNPYNPNNGYQQPRQQPVMAGAVAGAPGAGADTWTCQCGQANTGKFCYSCGTPKPAPQSVVADGWTCSCGAQNTGKFCPNCGNKKPENKVMRCDKCGWIAPAGTPPMKFCPECGDPVNEADYV